MARRLSFLVPRLAVSAVFCLLLLFSLDFFLRPMAMVVVRIVNQEYLFAKLVMDRGDGFDIDNGLHAVLSPAKRSVGIIGFRLPEGAARNFLFLFNNATSTTPGPVYIQSIDFIIDGRRQRWGPAEIVRDFGFFDVSDMSTVSAPGSGTLLRLVPSNPNPSLFLASGIPGSFLEEYLPLLRRWQYARGATFLLSSLLFLLLLFVSDRAAAGVKGALSRSRVGHLVRRLLASTPLAPRVALALILLVVFAVAFPNISVGNFHSYGEALEDFLVVQFSLESVVNGFLPLWNPYINNGQPFTWNYLMMGFPPVSLCYALLVKGASLLLPIDLGHAAKLLLLVYMVIMTTGLVRLFSHFIPGLPRFSRVTLAVLTCYIYAIWHYYGLNVTVTTMFAFLPHCLYYLFRFLEDRDRRTLWKLVLFFMLLFHSSGPYIVPFTLILGNFLLFGAVFSGSRVAFSLLTFVRRNYLQIGMMILTLGLCVGYKVHLYLLEYPDIVRIGRNLGNVPFYDFLFKADQGPSGWARVVSYFVPGDKSATFVGVLTLLPFCYALSCGAFWRRFRAVIPGVLFLGSVVLMDHSPFFNLIYVSLFPSLTKVTYWGVYYDVLLIFYMLFVAEGVRLLVERFSPIKVAVLLAGLALPLDRLNAQEPLRVFSLWHLAALVPILLAMHLAKRSADSRAVGVAGLVIVLLMASEFGFHLAGELEKSRQDQMVQQVGEDPAIRQAGSAEYPFRARRRIHEKRPFEHWLFGLPLISREVVFNPYNGFVTTRRQVETDLALDDLNRPVKYGISRDLLWLSRGFELVESEAAMFASMKSRPEGDYLLVEDPVERSRIEGLLRGDPSGALRAGHEVVSFNPNHLALDVTVSGPCILYYADSWHRDWRVKINGKEGPIRRANGSFKAIVLPAEGRYRIKIEFRPIAFIILFAIGNLVLLVPLLFILRARPDPESTSPSDA